MTEEERAAFQERMMAMRTSMDNLTKDSEAALSKILDAKQKTRLLQIQLQQQGLNAFRGPELTTKLNISEEVQAQITEVLDGQNEARRASFGKMREIFAEIVPDNGNGRPDRQAIQDAMAKPEVQAKMAEQRKTMDADNATLETKTKAGVFRLLSKKQKASYEKMVGAPFDLSKLQGPGGFGRPGGPGGPRGGAPGAGAAPANTTAAPAAGNPAAAPAKKSLRDRRGSSTPSDN
jgi:predicted phage tail protein